MYTINSKATTKTKQTNNRCVGKETIQEAKQNHKLCSISSNKNKEERRNKQQMGKKKIVNNQMVDVSPVIPIITFKVSGLNTQKRTDCHIG